jgi:hypothetical protein
VLVLELLVLLLRREWVVVGVSGGGSGAVVGGTLSTMVVAVGDDDDRATLRLLSFSELSLLATTLLYTVQAVTTYHDGVVV